MRSYYGDPYDQIEVSLTSCVWSSPQRATRPANGSRGISWLADRSVWT